jgi:hypothetical protein
MCARCDSNFGTTTTSGKIVDMVMYPTFKGCLQRIDISGQILEQEQISPKNCQENQRLVNLPLERGMYLAAAGKYLRLTRRLFKDQKVLYREALIASQRLSDSW